MLDVLLATMSFIAAMSMFFLCWLGWTMNKQLQHNDNIINGLNNEIDMLRERNAESYQSHKRIRQGLVKDIEDLEEITELDNSRIIRLNNIIEKYEEKEKLQSFKEHNQ